MHQIRAIDTKITEWAERHPIASRTLLCLTTAIVGITIGGLGFYFLLSYMI